MMHDGLQLYDTQGRRLSLTSAERDAFLNAATQADRPIRTLCSVLYYTGCRISEALALTARRIDINDHTILCETLTKRRRGVYRAVPVPEALSDTVDVRMVSERPISRKKKICSLRCCGHSPAIRLGGMSRPSWAPPASRTAPTGA